MEDQAEQLRKMADEPGWLELTRARLLDNPEKDQPKSHLADV
jgi:hypothetical protein